MPRTKSKTRSQPGSERRRDESRPDALPRMHGREWHDHGDVHALQHDWEVAPDAVPEVEASPEHVGMGRAKGAPFRDRAGQRESTRTPRGKGMSRAGKESGTTLGPQEKTELTSAQRKAAHTNRPGEPSRRDRASRK